MKHPAKDLKLGKSGFRGLEDGKEIFGFEFLVEEKSDDLRENDGTFYNEGLCCFK